MVELVGDKMTLVEDEQGNELREIKARLPPAATER